MSYRVHGRVRRMRASKPDDSPFFFLSCMRAQLRMDDAYLRKKLKFNYIKSNIRRGNVIF